MASTAQAPLSTGSKLALKRRQFFLSLPLDDWEKPCTGPAVVRTASQRIGPDRARLAEFAKALSEASSPVLIYGAAIDRGNGWSEAIAFAEALGAPVWAAPASERAPFPENHPLYRDHGKQFDDGRYELYKSTMKYDRDLGRSLHGYPSSAELPV